MEKLTYTEVHELELSDINKMSGTIEFSSAVTMGEFIKKARNLKKTYEADYAKFTITFI